MARPVLHRTSVTDGQSAGVGYRIEGELVPMLHLNLNGQVPVYFEHHVVLWKDPELMIGMHPLRGAGRRMLAGMPVFITETKTAGELALSRDDAGQIIPMHLPAGSSMYVREHQFLAATGSLAYTYERVRGVSNLLFGGNGFFVDRFDAQEDGVLWLHGYGNVFDVALAPGESIDVEPGGWIYRDGSVSMNQQVYGLKTGLLGGSGQLVFNRFTGPGRVGIQTMYVHAPTAS